jgi:hypothetical protein
LPARSLIGELGDAAYHFYQKIARGEVSDANVRAYLRAASQIEDVWQQIDDRVAQAIAGGMVPWEAYGRMRYALAFIRAARTYQVFVRELLSDAAAFEPATRGYLPRVTYDQANALCHQILPNVERAVVALNNPAYEPDESLPLELGPRIECVECDDGDACPEEYLQGIMRAAREVLEWAAGIIAQYELAIKQHQSPPQAITNHLDRLHAGLAHADAELRFAMDLVGQVSRGKAPCELRQQAEDSLWSALRSAFLVNQLVALPEPLARDSRLILEPGRGRAEDYHDQPIAPQDLWRVATPVARSQLQGSDFGRGAMLDIWQQVGGVISARAQRYLRESELAVARGDAVFVAGMASAPYEPLYRARRPLVIAGTAIATADEFHWHFPRNQIEARHRFPRICDWLADEE